MTPSMIFGITPASRRCWVVARGIDEDAAATDPEEEAGGLAVRVEAVARPEHGEAEVGRVERGDASARRGDAVGALHRRDRAVNLDAVDLEGVVAGRDGGGVAHRLGWPAHLRDPQPPVDDRPEGAHDAELEQVVDVSAGAVGAPAKVIRLPREVGPRVHRVGVGELLVVRRAPRREQRLAHHRPQAVRRLLRLDDDARAAFEHEVVVVGGELDLGERDAAASLEEIRRDDVHRRERQPERE
jgi:hypothetical protein